MPHACPEGAGSRRPRSSREPSAGSAGSAPGHRAARSRLRRRSARSASKAWHPSRAGHRQLGEGPPSPTGRSGGGARERPPGVGCARRRGSGRCRERSPRELEPDDFEELCDRGDGRAWDQSTLDPADRRGGQPTAEPTSTMDSPRSTRASWIARPSSMLIAPGAAHPAVGWFVVGGHGRIVAPVACSRLICRRRQSTIPGRAGRQHGAATPRGPRHARRRC